MIDRQLSFQVFQAPQQSFQPQQTFQQAPQPAYIPQPQPVYQPQPIQVQESQIPSQGYQTADSIAESQPSQAVQTVNVESNIQIQPQPQQQVAPNTVYQEIPGAAAAASKNAEVEEVQEEVVKTEQVKEIQETSTAAASAEGGEEKVVDISQLKLTDDPLCNSDDLRNLMLENIEDNLNSSKRLIQLAAEAQFGGRFDVICANGDFSYVTNTELFCQETKGDVSCYTYRQL